MKRVRNFAAREIRASISGSDDARQQALRNGAGDDLYLALWSLGGIDAQRVRVAEYIGDG